ncbi:MAG: AbrB/MazE/SpoVT family DNA-binding domain-containing protein [Trueperaceae bacterium]
MMTKVQRWGNSQGLRIPKELLETANITIGDDVHILAKEGKIVIEKRKKFDLKDMVSRMPKKYEVEEISLGKPMGKEVW